MSEEYDGMKCAWPYMYGYPEYDRLPLHIRVEFLDYMMSNGMVEDDDSGIDGDYRSRLQDAYSSLRTRMMRMNEMYLTGDFDLR